MEKQLEKLKSLNPCKEGLKFAIEFDTLQMAWDACQRGDWMLWLLGQIAGGAGSKRRKKLVLCACAVAREALRFIPAGEDRPRIAIETAEKYAIGEATIENVRSAAHAADAAADAYADAANVAYAAANAAAYAAAAYAAAKEKSLAKSAEIVRKFYPKIRI